MKYVTKKEYDNAIEILHRAVENRQVALQSQDAYYLITSYVFIHGFDHYSVNGATFISPEQAIKNRLFELRKEIKNHKEVTNARQKDIDALESEEKKLMATLPIVKE